MPETETCEGSGKLVSEARMDRAIYTDKGWIARCAWHDGTAQVVRAELKPSGIGYRRRYVEHNRT